VKIRIAILVAVFAVLGGLVLLQRGAAEVARGDAAQPVSAAPAARRLSPEAVLAIKPGGAPATRAKLDVSRVSPLMQELYAGKNWKALHERLRDAPSRTAEESYVLAALLERCAKVTDRKAPYPQKPANRDEDRKRFLATVSGKDPNAAQRIAAYDRVNTDRCEGFAGVVTAEAELRDLLARGAADPKARARLVEKDIAATLPADGAYFQGDGTSRLPSITDAQIEALKQAVQSGDPQAVSIAGRVFSTTMQNLALRAGPGEQPVDMRAFNDAWALAACDLGSPCGADNVRLLHACATRGDCGAHDLREHLFYFDHSPQQSQRVYEYYASILQASRSGDWSYFTFHGGPPPRGWVTILISK